MAGCALTLRGWLLLLLIAMLADCTSLGEAPMPDRVLIFSHTTGYRHDSIEVARPALQALVQAEGAEAFLSEDPALFSGEGLRGLKTIILLSTTTDPKNPASEWLTGSRREALQAFVRGGGSIVAIHAAADSHYHWPWYGRLIGAYFRSHPPGTPVGRLSVVDRSHASTRSLPASHSRADEWYQFKEFDPASRLLVTLDPASIGEAGTAQPISWTREVEGGRVFYTALGHTAESYSDPYFLDHVRGGLRWALGRD